MFLYKDKKGNYIVSQSLKEKVERVDIPVLVNCYTKKDTVLILVKKGTKGEFKLALVLNDTPNKKVSIPKPFGTLTTFVFHKDFYLEIDEKHLLKEGEPFKTISRFDLEFLGKKMTVYENNNIFLEYLENKSFYILNNESLVFYYKGYFFFCIKNLKLEYIHISEVHKYVNTLHTIESKDTSIHKALGIDENSYTYYWKTLYKLLDRVYNKALLEISSKYFKVRDENIFELSKSLKNILYIILYNMKNDIDIINREI